jgi:hypothetical protein
MPQGYGAQGATPAELLASNVVLTPTQLAAVLNLVYTRGARKGEPDVVKARDLIRSGAVTLVDPAQPPSRWTVAVVEVERYLTEGPRRTS